MQHGQEGLIVAGREFIWDASRMGQVFFASVNSKGCLVKLGLIQIERCSLIVIARLRKA